LRLGSLSCDAGPQRLGSWPGMAEWGLLRESAGPDGKISINPGLGMALQCVRPLSPAPNEKTFQSPNYLPAQCALHGG
jgi:hypothetical protein